VSQEVELGPQALIVELVVDTSASMDQMAPGTNVTKWEVTRDVLQSLIDSLPASLAMGLLLYPNRTDLPMSDTPSDVSACVDTDASIPIAPLGAVTSLQRSEIEYILRNASPGGGTPTYDAYSLAVEALDAAALPGLPLAVLITDGEPTYAPGCVGSPPDPVSPQPIIDAIAETRASGIRTYVIGSPGSETSASGDARSWLSQAALAGDTATDGCAADGPSYCHVDLTQSVDLGADLRRALAEIAAQGSCSFGVADAPAGRTLDPATTSVTLTTGNGQAETLVRSTTSACQQGWSYDAEQTRITLCSETCARVEDDPDARINVSIACE
jgi:hypothetical protein